MEFRKIFAFFSALLCLNNIEASNPYDPFLANKCVPSIPLGEKNLLRLMANQVNDLTKEHSPYLSNYDKAFIYGRVLDRRCKPLSAVNLKLWHENFKLDQKPVDLSGMTTTNNLGEFIFMTYIPEYQGNNIMAKILVTHDEYFPFMTLANLNYQSSFKEQDIKFYSKWLLKEADKYNQNYIYHIDIVLPIENEKIRY